MARRAEIASPETSIKYDDAEHHGYKSDLMLNPREQNRQYGERREFVSRGDAMQKGWRVIVQRVSLCC